MPPSLARVLIDMSGLVDIAIHCTYQTDQHGLQTSITPVMLVPACATCFSPCAACEKCRRYICGTCNEKHMLFDDLLHPNIYCSYCVDQKDYSSSASSERSDSCSGSLSADGSIYLFLQRLWENMATSRLKDGYWLAMAPLDGFITAPAKDIGTWMVISLRLASKYPHGIAVFDLDGKNCIVCAPGQAPAQANVSSALSWIRRMGDATIGIIVHGSSFACLSVSHDRRANRIREHRNVVMDGTRGLSFAEF